MNKLILLCLFSVALGKVYRSPVSQSRAVPTSEWIPERIDESLAPVPKAEPHPLSLLRESNFDCQNMKYGLYADLENDCKAYFVCQKSATPEGHEFMLRSTFTCAPGTKFDQKLITCIAEEDAMDCSRSASMFVETGLRFAIVPEEKREEYAIRTIQHQPLSQVKTVYQPEPVLTQQKTVEHIEPVIVQAKNVVHEQTYQEKLPTLTQEKVTQSRTILHEGIDTLAPEIPHPLDGFTSSFTCNNLGYGYYADMENNCAFYHICTATTTEAGLEMVDSVHHCTEGTQYDQGKLVCMHTEEAMNCADSGSLFAQTEKRFSTVPEEKVAARTVEYGIRGKTHYAPVTQQKTVVVEEPQVVVEEVVYEPPTQQKAVLHQEVKGHAVKGKSVHLQGKTTFYGRKI